MKNSPLKSKENISEEVKKTIKKLKVASEVKLVRRSSLEVLREREQLDDPLN